MEIKDTPEQTRAIFCVQAREAQTGEIPAERDYTLWYALQYWLEAGENAVVIPFAEELAALMPVHNAVRLRRNFPRILQLIKAHALLHQANRQRDGANRIVATIEDYAVVYALMAVSLAVEVDATVPDEIRETVLAVRQLSEVGKPTAISALARELGLDKSSVSRRVARAIQAGFLRNREPRKGLSARLQLGDDLPGSQEVLPPPEALEHMTP